MSKCPELTFDGKGINGPDEYRERIATFSNNEAASKYGPLLAAAPDLLEALRLMLEDYRTEGCPQSDCVVCERSKAAEKAARATIAKADGIYSTGEEAASRPLSVREIVAAAEVATQSMLAALRVALASVEGAQ